MKLTDITKELFDYLVAFRRKVSQASAPNLDVVRHELEMVFHNMDGKIAANRKLASEYRQVKYPLVVLADEIVLTSQWTHAKRWEQCLLEKKYFSSNIGGNQFFRLLANVDKMPTSVITIFFYCLAFGFRGGFPQDDPSLIRLKGRLFSRIQSSKKGEGAMLPEAYRADKSGSGRLPRVWRWRHLVIAAVAMFLLLLSIQRLVIWPLIIGKSMESLTALDEQDTDAAGIAKQEAEGEKVTIKASGYTVQLGAFSSEVLAIHFSQQIEQKGIETRILYKSNAEEKQRYLVLSGTFANMEAAMKRMHEAEKASTLVSEMTVLSLEAASGDCIHGCD